jgi:hypothetical protein
VPQAKWWKTVDEQTFQHFQARFQQLRNGVEQLRTSAAAVDRAVAKRFNLFHLLGVSTAEVRTHSAMLAELLNPHGSHAQGILFLKQFCTICVARDSTFPPLPAEAEYYSWVVEAESTPVVMSFCSQSGA